MDNITPLEQALFDAYKALYRLTAFPTTDISGRTLPDVLDAKSAVYEAQQNISLNTAQEDETRTQERVAIIQSNALHRAEDELRKERENAQRKEKE